MDTFDGRPATLQLGMGQWSPGMEQPLIGRPEGDCFSYELEPSAAYGDRNPELIQRVSRAMLNQHAGDDASFDPGDMVEFTAPNGGRYSGVLKEIDEIVAGNTDVSFMGLDFLNCCDKLYERAEAIEKKVPDFLIIARKSMLASAETVLAKVNAPSKQKSGNVMFKYILGEGARAVKVSCQMYLLRHEYAEPNNWQIYSEWTSQYHKSIESQKWVAENKKFIGTL
jgi:hypothetical protein